MAEDRCSPLVAAIPQQVDDEDFIPGLPLYVPKWRCCHRHRAGAARKGVEQARRQARGAVGDGGLVCRVVLHVQPSRTTRVVDERHAVPVIARDA